VTSGSAVSTSECILLPSSEECHGPGLAFVTRRRRKGAHGAKHLLYADMDALSESGDGELAAD